MKIGALVIGQTPRPDLVDPLRQRFPHVTIFERGALDHLDAAEIPPPPAAGFPLSTRLRDGRLVTVAQAFLVTHLQQLVLEFAAQAVDHMVLLCAGTFAELQHARLIKPFDVARDRCRQHGWQRLGLLTPVPGQERPIFERWQAAGFAPYVQTADLAQLQPTELAQMIQAQQLEALVIDYVGIPAALVAALQKAVGIPVLDVGILAMESIAM